MGRDVCEPGATNSGAMHRVGEPGPFATPEDKELHGNGSLGAGAGGAKAQVGMVPVGIQRRAAEPPVDHGRTLKGQAVRQ